MILHSYGKPIFVLSSEIAFVGLDHALLRNEHVTLIILKSGERLWCDEDVDTVIQIMNDAAL